MGVVCKNMCDYIYIQYSLTTYIDEKNNSILMNSTEAGTAIHSDGFDVQLQNVRSIQVCISGL